jgi:DNA-binding CsgD family transcriptional regulator
VFVGRETELGALGAALEDAIAGSGRIVMLAGEPGIGKTRTAEQAAAQASEREVRVLWGRCREDPGAPPYWPWVEAIRGYLEMEEAATLHAALAHAAGYIAEIVPEVAAHVPGIVAPAPLADAAQARFRLFDAVAGFLRRASTGRPILLVLDDLHRADVPSLRLLQFLAPLVASVRMLIVGTYRDNEVGRDHPLADALGELVGQSFFRRSVLKGLSRSETLCFIAEAAPSAAQSADSLHQRTEGNPLFLAEMVRFLGEKTAVESRSIPQGVREVIWARVKRLSSLCDTVISSASVIGRGFSVEVLARLLDEIPEERCVHALDEARAARVVDALSAPGAYQFTHALIREALYDDMPANRRMRLHQRTGEVMELLGRVHDAQHLSALAHHYYSALPAGDAAKAADFAERAARNAVLLMAHEEAERCYSLDLRANDLQPAPDGSRRRRLLLDLGEVQTDAGEYLAALECFRKAAVAARQAGDAQHLGRAALGFEQASWRPGLHGAAAAELVQAALELQAAGPSAIRARLLGALTRAVIFSGAHERARAVHVQAIATARETGDPQVLANVLCAGVSARWLPQQLPERLAAAREAIRIDREHGLGELAREALAWTVFDLAESGDLEEAVLANDAINRMAEELHLPFLHYTANSLRAMLQIAGGELDKAEHLAQTLLRVGQRMPGLNAGGVHALQMFSLRREQGRLKELVPLLEHFVATTPSSATWRPGLALLYAELQMADKARAELSALSADDFAAVARDGLWPACLAFLAEVCAYLQDAERAASLYSLLLPWCGHNLIVAPILWLGPAERYLGMLAAVMRRWQDAERHFNAALQLDSGPRTPASLAHTRYHFAAMLAMREPERAASLLDQALATARALNLTALVQRAEALGHKLSERRARPAGLSGREMQILRLIAEGKTNREIGKLLFISPNTVANQVRSILAKTSCSNRAEAAAFAVRQGMVGNSQT